jgi:mono/diheme cytochrome c family protein
VSPDGSAAGVTGQIPANERITREPLDIWTNTLFVFDPRGRPARGDDVAAEGWLDFSAVAAPDPGAAIALEPERFLVAAEGSDELLLVATRGPYLRSYDPGIRRRVRVGARPRALALSPDGREVWVACELENALVVVDPVELRILRRIELGDAGPPDPALRGRYLFGSGLLSRGGQFSCASCHPDGGTDGLTWQFAHVRDGLDRRNTRSLRGGVAGTAPFRWTGADAELDRFLAGEVTGLLGGAPPSPTVLGDIRTFLESLPIARRGAPAEAAAVARGDGLFAGKGACSGCHAGPRHGGTGLKAWVGTTPEGQALDVPHLAGLASSWPYLHDASARTLEEIFSARDPLRVHGGAHALTVEERRDLLAYLRTL